MLNTHIGHLLLNDALPEELRAESHTLDKKGTHELLRKVAEKYPDRYKEILKKLNDIGRDSVYTTGTSVSLSALRSSPAKEKVLLEARKHIQGLIDNDKIPAQDKEKQIIDTLLPLGPQLQEALFQEAKAENNPYYLQLISGARGKKSDYNSLRGADLLTSDHTGKIIPIPILNSYADGLDPVEFWAGLYGQRRGAIAVKFSTGDSGFLNKQLVNATHRMVVSRDKPDPTRLPVGLPVDPKDPDNSGAVLAVDVGNHKAGTVLTPEMLRDMTEKGHDEIIIHSPLTESSADGGVSQLAAGRRDRFGLSNIGDNIGIPAAQAIGEKLSQGALSAKHSSGVVGTGPNRAGFEVLNRLIQAPEHFPEAGPLAQEDGMVTGIEDAPQGGKYITVGKTKHYAHQNLNPTVAVGTHVDAGDDLTDGIPHPQELVKHRGIGEARRVYMHHMREILDNSGVTTHRRNLEAVVAGLVNSSQVTDPDGFGDHIVDDVVSHNQLTHGYQPRPTATLTSPKQAVGRYLEEPALHYTVGTKLTKRIADHLAKHQIKDVHTHQDPPGFQPQFQRGLMAVHNDDDWQTNLSGFYTSSAFSKALSRGATSDPNSTSFVSGLAQGTNFGKHLGTQGHYGPDAI